MAQDSIFRCMCNYGFCLETHVNMTVFVAWFDFSIAGCVHNSKYKLSSKVVCFLQSAFTFAANTLGKNAVLNVRSRIYFRSNQHEKILVTYLGNEMSLFCYITHPFSYCIGVTTSLSYCN